jgi:hypothetical protein
VLLCIVCDYSSFKCVFALIVCCHIIRFAITIKHSSCTAYCDSVLCVIALVVCCHSMRFAITVPYYSFVLHDVLLCDCISCTYVVIVYGLRLQYSSWTVRCVSVLCVIALVVCFISILFAITLQYSSCTACCASVLCVIALVVHML